MTEPATGEHELTEAEKRDSVIRLAFGGESRRLDAFVQLIKDFVPENTGVVLRGSAVTGSAGRTARRSTPTAPAPATSI